MAVDEDRWKWEAVTAMQTRYVITVGGGDMEGGRTSVFFSLSHEEANLLHSISRKIEEAGQDGFLDIDFAFDAHNAEEAERAEEWIAGAEERRRAHEEWLAGAPEREAKARVLRAALDEEIAEAVRRVEARYGPLEGVE